MKYIYSLLFVVTLVGCAGSDNTKETTNSAPKSFDVTVNNITENSADLTWTAAEDPDGDAVSYKVTLNDDSFATGITATNYTATDLTATTTYSGKVTASDGNGGATDATFQFTTDAASSGNSGESYVIPDDLKDYYGDVDFSATPTDLFDELATLVTSTHTTQLSYTPGIWDALKQSDVDPEDDTKIVLLYGYDDTDGNYITDRTRAINENGGTAGEDWNREHVYAKSLGNPNLGTSGPGADAHHLRPADVTLNAQRGNLKFIDGSGNAHQEGAGFYPGDEWKGDVARIIMYMYIHYGTQCYPTGVGIGTALDSDSHMVDLFIKWNAEDPVSALEIQRNNVVFGIQGNRNPFIDNPNLATEIWGGEAAENRWK
ncbi:endonuclease [Zhouia sp. PK063]|uniref:endonuclease n=1 Tax=Zhouia sp. PK063 TaxID=3373602 RepID=UPI0037A5A22D